MGVTPSQTVGPFFAIGLRPVSPEGELRLHGRVLDGEGAPVPDALVETWQAGGFGRCPTDGDGRWEVHIVKPDAVDGQAPHVAVAVFARGLLRHLVTRVYFADEPEANAADPVLAALGETERAKLIAAPDGRFDIHLQGPRETTFFAL